MKSAHRPITIVGAGITGLWQALTLAKAGHRVHLIERSPEANPFAGAASRYGGAMLAPDCEAEAAPPLVRDLGRAGLALWRQSYPDLVSRGSLVVASPRDKSEIARFSQATERHRTLDQAALAALEPALADRFDTALYYPDEAHMSAPDALEYLAQAIQAAGVVVTYGTAASHEASSDGTLIDCRGYAAADAVPTLRGVRGERVVVRAREVLLTRPVRLLHPRVPLYVVPWRDHVYMIGATVIESSDDGPMTVRSALELLGAAYALHPGFAEAAILEVDAGVRPALPDNVPRAIVSPDGRTIRVNGAYRHGFLLAPLLARAVAGVLEGLPDHPLVVRT
jgi:glycine oxidase